MIEWHLIQSSIQLYRIVLNCIVTYETVILHRTESYHTLKHIYITLHFLFNLYFFQFLFALFSLTVVLDGASLPAKGQ